MERFSEVASGVKWFKDMSTGLEWSETLAGCRSWVKAMDCAILTGGRLPSRRELFSLVDDAMIGPCTELPDSRLGKYWSSSTLVCDTTSAWYVNLHFGTVGWYSKDVTLYVRAVRGEMK